MVDFTPVKIEIYEGINDTPVAPNNTKGGNISHFYNRYNQLIDLIVQLGNELLNQIPPETETRITALETQVSSLDDYVNLEITADVTNIYNSINSTIALVNSTQQDTLTQAQTSLAEAVSTINNTIAQLPTYEGEISTLQVFLNDLETRVAALEGTVEPPPVEYTPMTDYILLDLEITTDGLHYQFTDTGTISYILVSGATNAYDIFFDLNGNTLYGNGYNTTPEGVEMSFSNEDLSFAVDDTFKIYVGGNTQTGVSIEINLVTP
jgi:hypothetical protein